MTLRASTNLALGLAILSWCLLVAGWSLPAEVGGLKVYRMFGFVLGGMASVPTFLLCVYYLRYRGMSSGGTKAAAAISGIYAIPFVALMAIAIVDYPLPPKWVAYVF